MKRTLLSGLMLRLGRGLSIARTKQAKTLYDPEAAKVVLDRAVQPGSILEGITPKKKPGTLDIPVVKVHAPTVIPSERLFASTTGLKSTLKTRSVGDFSGLKIINESIPAYSAVESPELKFNGNAR